MIQGDALIPDTVIDDGLVDTITVGLGEFWVLPPDVPLDPPAAGFAALARSIVTPDSVEIDQRSGEVFAIENVLDPLELISRVGDAAPLMAAALQMPRVRVRAVAVLTPSGTSTPPAGLDRMDEGAAFATEIWVQTLSPQDPGLAGLFLDVSTNPGKIALSSDAISLNDAFLRASRGSVLASAGLVDDVGGLTSAAGIAEGGTWVRLATLAMTAIGRGEVRISPLPGALEPALLDGVAVPWAAVLFEPASITIDAQFPNQNPVNRFDVDDNGIVEPFDLFILLSYLQSNSQTDPPPVNPQNPIYLDVFGDNQIDPFDLSALFNYFNEPAAISDGSSGDGLASFTQAVDAIFASLT